MVAISRMHSYPNAVFEGTEITLNTNWLIKYRIDLVKKLVYIWQHSGDWLGLCYVLEKGPEGKEKEKKWWGLHAHTSNINYLLFVLGGGCKEWRSNAPIIALSASADFDLAP